MIAYLFASSDQPAARQALHWVRFRRGRQLAAAILSCTLCFFPKIAQAVGPDDVHRQMDHLDKAGRETRLGFQNGSVVVAPVPFSNPTIGAGLALGAGYLFKTDAHSKTSVIGLGALRSDNGSQAVGLLTNLAFNSNRWLVSLFAGKADVRYDLYTPVGPIPLHQDGYLARLNLSYGVTEDLSFGGVFRYLDTAINLDVPGLPALPPGYTADLSMEIITAGLSADWDQRNDSDYPTEGSRLTAQATRSFIQDSTRPSYDTAHAMYDFYRPLGSVSNLALRGVICAAADETPFFDLCSIGATDNMRGFNSTQFLGQRSTSLQAEYRHRFGPRWGAVVFGGIGWTGAEFSQLGEGGSHSAAGLGARYRVSKKFPVDFSVDVSRNNLGDNQLYISVGNRF